MMRGYSSTVFVAHSPTAFVLNYADVLMIQVYTQVSLVLEEGTCVSRYSTNRAAAVTYSMVIEAKVNCCT